MVKVFHARIISKFTEQFTKGKTHLGVKRVVNITRYQTRTENTESRMWRKKIDTKKRNKKQKKTRTTLRRTLITF